MNTNETAQTMIWQLHDGRSPFLRPGYAMPVNALTGKSYAGIVALQLAAEGKEDPRWVTLSQVTKAGWSIGQRSKGTIINQQKTRILVPVQDLDGNLKLNENGKTACQFVKLDKPVLVSSTVLNGGGVSGIPPLADFLRERSDVKNEVLKERLQYMVKQLGDELQVPGLQQMDYSFLVHVMVKGAIEDAIENYVYDPQVSGMLADTASLMLASELGLDIEISRYMDYRDWEDILWETPEILEKIAGEAQLVIDHLLKSEPKRIRQQIDYQNTKENLQVGDTLIYKNNAYRILDQPRKNTFLVIDVERGNRFRMTAGDGIYNALLDVKKGLAETSRINLSQNSSKGHFSNRHFPSASAPSEPGNSSRRKI